MRSRLGGARARSECSGPGPAYAAAASKVSPDVSKTMTDLFVEVRGQDIIVTKRGTGLSVTYRRERGEPALVAMCPMRCDPDAPTLKFLAEAWKVAYAKATALGWLR